MKRKSSRRDFLTGKAAADVMAETVARALPDDDPQGAANRAASGSSLVHVARRAMACQFEVCFNTGQYPNDTEIALQVLDLVEALEAQMSVFREDSELCQINRTAARQPVKVEPGLFELLELAIRLQGETDGVFDVTASPLWEVWGFARRAGALPAEEQLAEALQHVGSHLVELDTRHKTIRFRRQGVQLNLGGIGKGYALDRCAKKLLQAGIEDCLIQGGHSSVLGRGSRAAARSRSPANATRGWEVGVRHPLHPDRRLAEIRLRDRALATSGCRGQSFVHQGRRYGHILDPRNGQPAEGVLSATVIAPSAAVADALSTAFFVMGPQAALDYCRTRPEIGTLLVCPINGSGGIEIQTAGLAEDELTVV